MNCVKEDFIFSLREILPCWGTDRLGWRWKSVVEEEVVVTPEDISGIT